MILKWLTHHRFGYLDLANYGLGISLIAAHMPYTAIAAIIAGAFVVTVLERLAQRGPRINSQSRS